MSRHLIVTPEEEITLACAASAFVQRLDGNIAEEKRSPDPDEAGIAALTRMRDVSAALAERLLATPKRIDEPTS